MTPRNPFIGRETVQRKIADRDGYEYSVTIRRLDAAGEAALQDQIRMLQSDVDDENIILPMLGQTKILTVKRCIVGWDLPDPYEPHMVDWLDPMLVEQIFEHIQLAGDNTETPAATEAKAADPLPDSEDSPPGPKPKLVATKS